MFLKTEFFLLYSENSQVNERTYYDDFYFKRRLQYFSISSETTLDRNSNSFASLSGRFELVLPPYFVFVRQPEMTKKPEVSRKTMRTAR